MFSYVHITCGRFWVWLVGLDSFSEFTFPSFISCFLLYDTDPFSISKLWVSDFTKKKISLRCVRDNPFHRKFHCKMGSIIMITRGRLKQRKEHVHNVYTIYELYRLRFLISQCLYSNHVPKGTLRENSWYVFTITDSARTTSNSRPWDNPDALNITLLC